MISIANVRDGAVLNAHHGKESADALTIRIEGSNESGFPVLVNGIPAEQEGLHFYTDVRLTQKINQIEASTMTPYGEFSQKITVVWDRQSFRRCGFYLDDHIFLFTELAKQRPRHAFDHFYLAALRKLHEKYGMRVTLNTFYHNDHEEFLLDEMPDTWRSEFEDNADWLRFALHAYSEFPDRPYIEVSRKQFAHDMEQFHAEIVRIAGEKSYIVPVVMHWGNISSGAAQELLNCGAACYSEAMRPRMMATPPADELSPEEAAREFRSEVYLPSQPALARHYGFGEEIDYMEKYGCRYDSGLKLFFFHDWIICNLLPLEKIPRLFAEALHRADRYGCDIFSAGGHEQYSFPKYLNYQPDHLQKLDETMRLMVEEAGCRSVFFQDGLLGNCSWDK